jgi:hypothetical protein
MRTLLRLCRDSLGPSHAAGLLCVLVAATALVAGCKGHGSMGHACGPSVPCPVDYACVIAFDGSDQCMASCTINETACMDGSACLPLQPGPTHACYVGGDVPIGSTCTRVTECVHGGICLATGSGGTGTCFVACNLDGTVGCSGGATCVATTDGNNGFCSVGP